MTINTILKVEDRPDLIRDPRTKAILSVDAEKLKEHRNKKSFLENINKTSKEVDELKGEIQEIKSTLNLILQKLSAN